MQGAADDDRTACLNGSSSIGSAQKSSRELFESTVARFFGAEQDTSDVVAQPGLAPVVSGGLLGAGRFALASGLEKHAGGDGVVGRVVAGREIVLPAQSA